ncbi:hypothetical protein GCM10028832_24190 [Streptomyces sparsus]
MAHDAHITADMPAVSGISSQTSEAMSTSHSPARTVGRTGVRRRNANGPAGGRVPQPDAIRPSGRTRPAARTPQVGRAPRVRGTFPAPHSFGRDPTLGRGRSKGPREQVRAACGRWGG